MIGKFRKGTLGLGSAVTVRRVLVVRGGARLFGVSRVGAVKALRVMSRLSEERLVRARLG